jgi:hypothetical protein
MHFDGNLFSKLSPAADNFFFRSQCELIEQELLAFRPFRLVRGVSLYKPGRGRVHRGKTPSSSRLVRGHGRNIKELGHPSDSAEFLL